MLGALDVGTIKKMFSLARTKTDPTVEQVQTLVYRILFRVLESGAKQTRTRHVNAVRFNVNISAQH